MKRQARQLLIKLLLSLVVEVVLNLVGFDDLANYSEFLFENPVVVQICAKCEIAG